MLGLWAGDVGVGVVFWGKLLLELAVVELARWVGVGFWGRVGCRDGLLRFVCWR